MTGTRPAAPSLLCLVLAAAACGDGLPDPGSLGISLGTPAQGSSDPHFAVVQRFAPRLRFDGATPDYPMSAEPFWEQAVAVAQTQRIDNTDYGLVTANRVPTYYQTIQCGNQLRIRYWWFYGYQSACDAFGDGTHNGDWESITLLLSEDQSSIAAIQFEAHGNHYTRLAARGGFDVEEGTHPVVYPGKTSHASYYGQGGSGTCLYWEDYRNNWSGNHLDGWMNLLSLQVDSEPWMRADRAGGFSWGTNGVSRHPTQDPPTCAANAADWSLLDDAWRHSQCKRGDRDDGTQCHVQCRPGYTDMGYTCTNWSWWSWDTYTQSLYHYDWLLPTSDLGLLTNQY